jgi:hypothetical protein
MALARKSKKKDTHLRRGDKVVATVDLPGVPEGTVGRVKLVNGFLRPGSWTRYWVFFSNGVDRGSISEDELVLAKEWVAYQEERARRAEEGEAAQVAAAAKAETAPADTGAEAAPAAASSRIPAHLLERAKARRQSLGQG